MPARTTSSRRPASARSRSGSTAASKKRPPAKRTPATNRRPAAKKKSSPGLWGVVAGSWNLLARGAGGIARSVARPEEAEPLAPEHRRDGVGLAVLGLAIVLGAAAWSDGIGPVGGALANGVRWIIGSLVMVLPVVLFFAALRLLRRGPRPEARGRLAIRWVGPRPPRNRLAVHRRVGSGHRATARRAGRSASGPARFRWPRRLGGRYAAGSGDRHRRRCHPAGTAALLRPAGHHGDAGAPDPRAAARVRRPPARPRRVRR